MKLSEKIQEALREQQEINLSDPAVQKRLAAQWGYVPAGAQPAPNFADAYQGAMEEVAIWKKRALEAEDLNRKFVAEINGPAYMGEPAQPAPSEQDAPVRKAWARFSHALHRSPDAPYPGMADAFEQHFSQSFIDREWRVEASTWAAAWKAAKRHCAQPALSVPDDVVEQAVNRFLSWKLPKDFHPDGGTVFIPTKGRGYDSPHWPIGTNLLNAQQAREMLRYVLAAAPETKP